MLPLKDENPTRRPPIVTALIVLTCLWVYFGWQPSLDPSEPVDVETSVGVVRLDASNAFTFENAAIPCEVVQGRPLTLEELAATFTRRGPGPAGEACEVGTASGPSVFPDKSVWLSLLTSMFLHGGLLHLGGNLLFLWIFGNNIEDHLGHVRFALFYLVGGFVASAAHVALNLESTIPVVGASGAIAAVMGAYLVWFPRAPVLTLVFLGFFVTMIGIQAKWLLGFWFVSQFFTNPNSGVAWAVHVGGFVFGVVMGLMIRSSQTLRRAAYAWGGTLENRVRFSATVLDRIRVASGDDFVVGLAVNLDPDSEGSLSVAELQEIVAWHDERSLIDYVTCGTGSYFDPAALIPTSLYPPRLGEPFASALKDVVHHAVVQAESHIRTPAAAETVLAAGHADMVSIVRGQIADPHLVAKARRGATDEVRPCISCNQLCWGRRSRDYWISCLVNPSAGREVEWGGDRFQPATEPGRVLVVGGGPAGLEAARVAAERGHAVTLVEAGEKLGGQWRLAGVQPSRDQILDHLRWYERELSRLDVEARCGVAADAGTIAAVGADHVVIAVGAEPARPVFSATRVCRTACRGSTASGC